MLRLLVVCLVVLLILYAAPSVAGRPASWLAGRASSKMTTLRGKEQPSEQRRNVWEAVSLAAASSGSSASKSAFLADCRGSRRTSPSHLLPGRRSLFCGPNFSWQAACSSGRGMRSGLHAHTYYIMYTCTSHTSLYYIQCAHTN